MAIGDDTITGATTERMIGGLNGILTGNKRNHSGVRLIDELMVDIMGGLIPGVLFISSLLVCTVLPIIIYEYIKPHDYTIVKEAIDNHFLITGGTASSYGGWFWFAAFLTFLIISYIAGHIFYRSDINMADKKDIERRKNKNASIIDGEIHNKDNQGKTVVEIIQELLLSELKVLVTDDAILRKLNHDSDQETEQLRRLLDFINKSISRINETKPYEIIKKDSNTIDFNVNNSKQFLYYTLQILFPQSHFTQNEEKEFEEKTSYSDIVEDNLSLSEKHVFESYLKEARNMLANSSEKELHQNDEEAKKIKSKKKKETSFNYDNYKAYGEHILACYLLLFLQNDSACSNSDNQSDYPYLEFYKYLLKRNETDLLKYVDWSPAGARTKNKINRMKISIQLDYPDAYAILNKNESHIRMASSSWHVSRFIKIIASYSSIAFLVIACLFIAKHFYLIQINHNPDNDVIKYVLEHINKVLVILPPLLLYQLMKLMKERIEYFIHYQRLREIYFTLFIYHKLEEKKKSIQQSSQNDNYCYYY